MPLDLTGILKELNVGKVYWIDDEHATAADLEPKTLVKVLAKIIGVEGVDSIGKITSNFKKEAQTALGALISNFKKSANNDLEFDLEANALQILEKLLEDENIDANSLDLAIAALSNRMGSSHKDLIKEIFDLSSDNLLSFTDWDNKKDEILKAHNSENVVLLLLDQFNNQDTSSSNGKTVLSEIINHNGFCVLSVSNNCKKDDEFNATEQLMAELSKGHSIDTPVFVFSKARLTNKPETTRDIINFLSRFILSKLNAQLATKTKVELNNAIDSAFESLKKLSFIEFVHAIHHSSQYEGVSELDTLLRIFAIEQRRSLFNAVAKDPSIHELLSKIRSVSLPLFTPEQLSSISSLVDLRRSEVFEPSEVINPSFEPIAVGDIFSCTKECGAGSNSLVKKFILIGNSCDLMIRGDNGKRKLTGEALLLPVVDKPFGEQTVLLPSPLDPNVATQYVDKFNFSTIPIDILDLCAYNEDGESIWIDEDSLLKFKSKLLPSQILRGAHLAKNLTADLSLRCRINHLSTATQSDQHGIKFNVKRIARLTPDVSALITHAFSSSISRSSLGHDYVTSRDSGGRKEQAVVAISMESSIESQ